MTGSSMVLVAMIKIADILSDSIVDGPGIRAVIFCQGCPHHCPGCHNASTWPFEGGTPMDEKEILALIKKNPLVRGVTFSGGEPFSQAEGFSILAALLKSEGYEVACYTGYTFEELFSNGTVAQRKLLETIDILIDGPFLLSQRTLDLVFRGSRNQRILNVRESLLKGKPVEEVSPRWNGKYL